MLRVIWNSILYICTAALYIFGVGFLGLLLKLLGGALSIPWYATLLALAAMALALLPPFFGRDSLLLTNRLRRPPPFR